MITRNKKIQFMKKATLFLFALFLANVSFSQRWEKLYGTPVYHEWGYDLIECNDKGYLMSGGSTDFDGNWLIKTDINGEMLWEKHIVYNNSFVLPGFLDQNEKNEFVAANTIAIDYNADYWASIVKFDSCGERQWCRIFDPGIRLDGAFYDVMFLDNGNILALLFANKSMTVYCAVEIYLYCFDPDGKLLWIKPYASIDDYPLLDATWARKIDKFGNGYVIYGDCYWAYPGNPNHVFLRPLIIGLDSVFNEKYVFPFGRYTDSIHGMAYGGLQLNDSVYMAVGTRWIHDQDNLVNNGLMMFFNKKGEELGYRQILNEKVGPDVKSNFIIDIQRINDSLFLAVSNYGKKYEQNPFGGFVLDSGAHIYYKDTIPNTIGDPRMVITSDSNYLVIHTIQQPVTYKQDILLLKVNDTLGSAPFNPGSYVYDSLCKEIPPYEEINITDCMVIVGIENTPTPEQYYASLKTIPIKVFPNPAKDKVNFELENTELHQNIRLRCYDLLGKLMYNEPVIKGQKGAAIDISSWPSGMFVAIIYSNSGAVGKCKFVVEGNK
jgi:hypothetical protein